MEERKVKVITLKPWEVPPLIRKQMAYFKATTGKPMEMDYYPILAGETEETDE